VQFRGASWIFGLFFLLSVLALAGGCQPNEPLNRAGVGLAVSSSWQPVAPSTWMVPGTALAAWSGPDGSSLVVYRTLPLPGGTSEMIAEGLTNRLTNLPGLEVKIKRTEKIAGEPAARVEVIAPGNGDSLAPSGAGTPIATGEKPLMATRQVTIGFPRQGGSLFLSWHMPESAYSRISPDIEAALGSLQLSPDGRPSSYSY
jgi:hypothetical protein